MPDSATIVKALNCPNCGAALTIRAGEHTLSVVCVQCLSVLEAKDPNLQVLQQFQERERIQPLIPLGTRGKWRGDTYEVIGFQVRTIEAEGIAYSWSEYLLFNPYKGFRYLTEYNGHWNDVKTVRAVPEATASGGKSAYKLLGRTYVHFQTASAETTYVMGEFPWQVHVGEKIAVSDFISPPQILSSETTESETVWSLGEYTEGARVWEAFGLPGTPPVAAGVFANQPSPFEGKTKQIWIYCGILLLVLLNLALFFSNFARKEEVFQQLYTFTPGARGEASFVTPTFELKGRPSGVELSISTSLHNDWAYFNFALINEATGQAYDFGREVSYYSDEGSPNDRVLIPSVPAGRYYLRVEAEMSSSPSYLRKSMTYRLRIRRDVPWDGFFWIAGLLLIVPPVMRSLRAAHFEKARWQESDSSSQFTFKAGSSDDDS